MLLDEEKRKRRDRKFREFAAILAVVAVVAFLIACIGLIMLLPYVVLYSFIVSAVSLAVSICMARPDPDDPNIFDNTFGSCPPPDPPPDD